MTKKLMQDASSLDLDHEKKQKNHIKHGGQRMDVKENSSAKGRRKVAMDGKDDNKGVKMVCIRLSAS